MRRTVRRLQAAALAVLTPALLSLGPTPLLHGLTIGLGVLTALKLREARTAGEGRSVALLVFLTAGMLAGLRPELGPSLLQAVACLLALASLAAIEMDAAMAAGALLRRGLQLLAAALPMALVLLLLLPRLDPFTSLPEDRGTGAVTGLSPSLEPGGISALAVSHAPAARVSFPDGTTPPPPGERYWRVLVHGRYEAGRWIAAEADTRRDGPSPLPAAGAGELRELWLEEPSGLKAVPWSGRGRPLGPFLQVDADGVLRHRGRADRRRVYALDGREGDAAWQRRPPGRQDLELPAGGEPRLRALAAAWAEAGPAARRVEAAERWFRSQPFRYTLRPGALPATAPLDAFLFERREGFCGHYASAFTALMRAAGVPARVVSGYRGGDWVVPLGGTGYLDLRRSDAHAWSEVWLEGEGWRRVDPSAWTVAGAAAVSGDPAAAAGAAGRRGPAGVEWLRRQWWGLDLAWTRWWLGFDRERQEELLRRLLGERIGWVGLLVVAACTACLAAAVALLVALQRGRRGDDPLRRELGRWLDLWRRRGLRPQPGETLACFAARLVRRWPALEEGIGGYVRTYSRLRFGAGGEGATGRGELRRQRRRLARRLGRLSG
jgi:transglutaminase-like putative cysteine protease